MNERHNRISDALQTARNLQDLMREIQAIEHEVEIASLSLEKLNNHVQPDSNMLEILGLSNIEGYALRLRLNSIITVKEHGLSEAKIKLNKDWKILQNILVCTNCQGRGEISKQVYERFERSIQPRVIIEKCKNCGGTGRIDLGQEVKSIIEKISDSICNFKK